VEAASRNLERLTGKKKLQEVSKYPLIKEGKKEGLSRSLPQQPLASFKKKVEAA
jgi:hypothetical protein